MATLTQAEAEEKLEELQQQVTLNLQEIDKNFAECTRIINELTIPDVERYAEQTNMIWELSKDWSWFFDSMNLRTRMPAYENDSLFPLFSPSSSHREHTMSNISAYVKGLRKQMQEESTQDTTTSEYSKPSQLHDMAELIGSKRKHSESTRSPPRMMPYITEPSSLANTPRNEAARILTENSLQAVDMGETVSPDEFFDDLVPSAFELQEVTPGQDDENRLTGGQKDWGHTDLMEVESEEQRKNFDRFYQKRQTSSFQAPDHSSWQWPSRVSHSPSNRYHRTEQLIQQETEPRLVGTPTIERVLDRKQLNLKSAKDDLT
ncbi:DASH complex subunit Ask1-domain-containing protein [Blakeslea trispora]|nr:DASH complex subunit Ask1-domain-containing protein [Blakeslea trispora]